MSLAERIASFDPQRSARSLDCFSFAAGAYLLVPNLIFLIGWFHPVVALPVAALGFWELARRAPESFVGPRERVNRRALLLILVVVACWVALGGAGHFFFANHDWRVRDAVLGDLVFGAWPAAYANSGGDPLLLRSAMGFFLPAALVGKVLGIAWVDWAMYCWTVLGTTIFVLLLPLPRRPGLLLLASLLIVCFFSGMDLLGFLLVHDRLPNFPHAIEWWVPYSYSSLSAQLFWAPNHSLPIWILTALIYRHWAHAAIWRLMFFVLPLSLIWTPFAIAGVLPLLLIAALRWWKIRQALGIDYRLALFSVVLTYVSLRFITLDLGGLPIHSPAGVTQGTNVSMFPVPSLTDYLVFVEIEFGILALALLPTLRHSFGMYWIAVGSLLLLPIVSLGPSKDTMLRLSVPPLIVLLILVLSNLQDWAEAKTFPAIAYVVGVILLLGAPSAYSEMARAVLWPRTVPNYTRSLVEQQGGSFPPHYVARLNQPDLRWILNRPQLVPASAARNK